MGLELIKATALLLALSCLQGFIARFTHKNSVLKQYLSGALFGGICVIGMMAAITFPDGVIFDPRSVILSVAGFLGGPIVAFVAALIAALYRISIGGGGMNVGVTVIVICPCIGLILRYLVHKRKTTINLVQLLIFGFFVHLVVLGLFTFLPPVIVAKFMSTVAIPYVLIFTLATAFLVKLLQDGENRFKMESALRKSEANLSFHLQNTPLAAISWDKHFNCIQWNKAAERIFGYSAEEALGKHGTTLIINDSDQKKINALFNIVLKQEKSSRNTNVNITKSGNLITCEWFNTPITNNKGKVIGLSSLCEDITERKLAEELIWKQAHYDALTGLANRELLCERLVLEIQKAAKLNQRVALLYLDLDQFKDVNDTLGHHVGDTLLIEAARRLSTHAGDSDIVARLGGDEFTLVIGGIDNFSDIERVAKDLLNKMAEPYILGNEIAYITTSIGITMYPDDASVSTEMLKNADQAMYAAKKSGRNCFRYFTSSMQDEVLSRLALVKDLRTAIPNNEFQLYYQPIVNLATGNIHKAEALIRWHHPKRGLVSPIEFIPIAEETNMIIDIGDWVFREAAKQCSLWRENLTADFQVSVNTSPMQYMHANIGVNEWLKYLDSLGLSGDAVAVEITEGVLMQSDSSVTNILLGFRDAGIQVSLDDFGTGYSSMSYLKKLDIDYIKIDKLFVMNLQADSDDLALCEAIIVMAHKLGITVIAEGIETKLQSELLRAAGCDYGQGYFFSKPVPADEFTLNYHA